MKDKCPYSKNDTCNACRVLKIKCNGELYYRLCTQYQIVNEEITPEMVGKDTLWIKS